MTREELRIAIQEAKEEVGRTDKQMERLEMKKEELRTAIQEAKLENRKAQRRLMDLWGK